MKLIVGLVVLIAYDQLGRWLIAVLGWPVPGSVLGMLLLLISLVLLNKPPAPIKQSAEFLLRHLSLLFVPAGVGIMLLLELIADEWLAMLVAMVFSTLIALALTAWMMQGLLRMYTSGDDHDQ